MNDRPDPHRDSAYAYRAKMFNIIQELRVDAFLFCNGAKFEGEHDDDLVKAAFALAESLRDTIGTYTKETHEKQKKALSICKRAYKRALRKVEEQENAKGDKDGKD